MRVCFGITVDPHTLIDLLRVRDGVYACRSMSLYEWGQRSSWRPVIFKLEPRGVRGRRLFSQSDWLGLTPTVGHEDYLSQRKLPSALRRPGAPDGRDRLGDTTSSTLTPVILTLLTLNKESRGVSNRPRVRICEESNSKRTPVKV